MLEAVDAAIEALGHLLRGAIGPAGDRDVEAVVGAGLLRPLRPLVERVGQALLRRGDAHVDQHGGAAGQRRRGAGEEVLDRDRAHEGHLHVGVRVDAARDDQRAAGFDDLGPAGRLQPLADRHDLAVRAQHVRPEAAVRIDHRPAAHQYRHGRLPFPRGWVGSLAHAAARSSGAAGGDRHDDDIRPAGHGEGVSRGGQAGVGRCVKMAVAALPLRRLRLARAALGGWRLDLDQLERAGAGPETVAQLDRPGRAGRLARAVQRLMGGFRGGAGRRGRGLGRGVADGVLGGDVVAQAGGTALHHAAQGVPAVAAGARLRRLLGGRPQAAAAGPHHPLGQGHGRVAVVELLLEDEHGDRRLVAHQRALQRLTGEQDQAPALGLRRLGQAVDAGGDEGAELLAREQALDQRLVAALGQGGGARRQAGGEAVGDPQPVLGPRALAAGGALPPISAAIR